MQLPIEIYFVVKNEYKDQNDVSDDMQLAFMNSMDWQLCPKWIKLEELLNTPNGKGKVIVLEEFQDEFIKRFQETHPNARIVGPRCVLSCHMEDIPVPWTLSPVWNMAMNKLVICSSKLPLNEKKKVSKFVGYMGGEFIEPLTSRVTHLISTSALTRRHIIACEKGMTIVTSGWVEKVWELNFKDYVKATDYDIMKKYSCPIFYKMNVTGSSITQEEKMILEEKINKNGGRYSKEMRKDETHILITTTASGEKFKYALRWSLPCVQPAWVDECIKKGHTISYDNFIVRAKNEISSTQVPKPVVQKPVSLIDTNESDLSIIPSNISKNTVNETEPSINEVTLERCLPSVEASAFKTPTKTCPRRVQQSQVSQYNLSMENNLFYKEVLSDIDLKELKKCGPIFDGCKLYLTGFNSNEEEKLRKVLTYGGAIRFAELNESVTHIVVGNPSNVEMQRIKSIPHRPHVVTVDWLCNSIKQKGVVKETSCSYFEDDKAQDQSNPAAQQPSPLSKKGYQMLNPSSMKKPEPPRIPDIDRELIEKYSQSSQDFEDRRLEPVPAPSPAVSIPLATNAITPAPSDYQTGPQSSTLFSGLKFALIGHDPHATETFKTTLVEYGGTIVTNTRMIVDYAIVPLIHVKTNITCDEIVTMIWLEDCLFNMKVMDVKYYHLPISTSHLPSNPKPLTDCVITLSSYDRQEKSFLENLGKLLGARCQEVLSKKINPEMNVVRTTHLVCAQPQGQKYDAAKKWNLPIVTEIWIRDCFKSGTKLPVEDYLTMFVKTSSQAPNSSQKVLTPMFCRGEPEPSTSKLGPSRRSISNQEIPNFCAAASSTKVGAEILKDVNKCMQQSDRKVSLRQPRLNEKNMQAINGVCSGSSSSRSSSPGENAIKVEECSRASRSNNGPTSLILEMNASKGRSSITTGKRKSRPESSDCKFRSPKKKTIALDKLNLTPVEEVGWHDTLTDLSHRDLPESTGLSQSSQRSIAVAHRAPRNPAANSQTEKRTLEPSKSIASKQTSLKKSHNIMISLEIERDTIEELIKNLGGTVAATYEPDSKESERATHLIIEDMKKTEKMLCSIAAGLWVLRDSYLKACVENNAFVNEEDYEWGNPKNSRFLDDANAETKQLAAAAHRWRIKILTEGPSKRPFVGMKAVIASKVVDGTVLSLQRIIRAGGGRVLQPKDVLKCTHCFLKSNNSIENILAPLEVLATERIHVLPAIYLRDFLIHHPPPEPQTKYVPEYKQLFK